VIASAVTAQAQAAPPEFGSSVAAELMFFGVVAVLAVGALVLYLRNRSPRP
jgi:hypothetical protein